jgi:hypothetical protein
MINDAVGANEYIIQKKREQRSIDSQVHRKAKKIKNKGTPLCPLLTSKVSRTYSSARYHAIFATNDVGYVRTMYFRISSMNKMAAPNPIGMNQNLSGMGDVPNTELRPGM